MTAPDRPGWGESPAPEDYRRTSIAEQATFGAAAIPRSERGPGTLIVGEGFGAVVGLEIALARPDEVAAVAMIDPPVLGLLPAATAGVSTDTEIVRETVERKGPEAAYEVFLAGGLHTLGAGAERLGALADRRAEAARSFLVELPAVPGWSLDPERFTRLDSLVFLVSLADSPDLLREAADSLLGRIPGARRLELESSGPDASVEALAALVAATDPA